MLNPLKASSCSGTTFLVCHAKILVFEYCVTMHENQDNKLLSRFFSLSLKQQQHPHPLSCPRFTNEKRGETRKKWLKQREWESRCHAKGKGTDPRLPQPLKLSMISGNVPSSSTSDSISFTSSFVAIIPRFFMTRSNSSVVMVSLLSTSKILKASLNSGMIKQQKLLGFM